MVDIKTMSHVLYAISTAVVFTNLAMYLEEKCERERVSMDVVIGEP